MHRKMYYNIFFLLGKHGLEDLIRRLHLLACVSTSAQFRLYFCYPQNQVVANCKSDICTALQHDKVGRTTFRTVSKIKTKLLFRPTLVREELYTQMGFFVLTILAGRYNHRREL